MWEKIIGDIDKVRHIVEQWQQSGQVHDIEKEVALDKLRAVYEDIKFSSPRKAEPMPPAAAYSAPVQEEAVPLQAAELKNEQPGVKAEPPEPSGVYDTPLKQRSDRKKLMSLYGEGNYPAPEAPEAAAAPGVSETTADDVRPGEDILQAMGFAGQAGTQQAGTAPAAGQTVSQNIPQGVPAGRPNADQGKVVFADTVKAGETLADMYARNNKQEDVAARLKNSTVTSIRLAMGINDRFLLMRDLFGGDGEACDRTVRELDLFTDLDDAMLYIHDNFTWNPEVEGAKLIIDLLTRKLS